MAWLTSSGAAALHETGKSTFPSFSGGVPRGVSFSPCPHAPEAPAPSMIANVNAPTVLPLVMIASLSRLSAARNAMASLVLRFTNTVAFERRRIRSSFVALLAPYCCEYVSVARLAGAAHRRSPCATVFVKRSTQSSAIPQVGVAAGSGNKKGAGLSARPGCYRESTFCLRVEELHQSVGENRPHETQ